MKTITLCCGIVLTAMNDPCGGWGGLLDHTLTECRMEYIVPPCDHVSGWLYDHCIRRSSGQ